MNVRGTITRIFALQSAWIIVALIGIVAVFTAMRPEVFLTPFNIRSMASDASILLVLAVGQTLVIIARGIDLSVGSVLVFAGVVAAKFLEANGGLEAGTGTIIVGALVACAAGAAWGLLNGVLIAKLKIPSLIATLATMGAALGLAQIITGGIDLRGIPTGLTESLGYGRTIFGIPWLVVTAAIIAGIGAVALHLLRFGRHTFAVGSNEEAARRVGINVDMHQIKVYVVCGLCAGIAGYLSLAKFASTTISGHSTDNLATVTAVVLGGASLFGGVGSMGGTTVGVLIPTVLASGLVIVGVQPFWQSVAVAIVLVLAVYLDQVKRRRRAG